MLRSEWEPLIYSSLAIGRAQNCFRSFSELALTSSAPWLREWATPTWRQRSGCRYRVMRTERHFFLRANGRCTTLWFKG